MIAARHCYPERFGKAEIESHAVYSRHPAENVLPVDINHGIGYGLPLRIKGKFENVFIPVVYINHIEVGVENEFARAAGLSAVTCKHIPDARGRDKPRRR